MTDISSAISDFERAVAHHREGRLDEAETLYRAVMAKRPEDFDVLHSLGLLCAQKGANAEAAALIGRAVELKSDHVGAINNLGLVLKRLGRFDEAMTVYDRGLAISPDNPDLLVNRGSLLLETLHRPEEALASFEHALAVDPESPGAWNNRGNAFRNLKRWEEALASYDRAFALRPDSVDVIQNRATALRYLQRFDEAARTYEHLLRISPAQPYVPGKLLQARLLACDWTDYGRRIDSIEEGIRRGDRQDTPWPSFAYLRSAALQKQCAEIFVADSYPSPPVAAFGRHRHDRIRVAWLSDAFREGVESQISLKLLEWQDKTKFETFGVALGDDDGSLMRKRMVGAFEHFVDGRNKSDDEIARYLREKEIDIAVCLIGFVDGRQGIFASRIAPVQVNLGYGGTMGASFIDYIVADRHVIPEACEVFYREKVVRLPEPSMGYYEPPEPEPTPPPRASLGLPSAGFVFCCFNAHYKIQPDVFDVWMKLLRDVEGSVLWLREGPAEVTTNLRREAERRGIKADRLVFAPPLKRLKDHLARHRAADLFVDNVPYSAHTTACDALWAGLPLVTCSGETFVSRVAGGLLKSVGLPELVAGNLADYEAVIRRLVAKPALLLDIKAKLARQRRGGALFNPERFCRYLENAFVTMHDRQRRGLPPESFDVPAAAPKSFLSRLLRSK